MSRLPVVSSEKMEKLLFSLGFARVRMRGSHAFYRHPDGRATTIPHHKGRILARPLIRSILRDIRLSIEEYAEGIQKI